MFIPETDHDDKLKETFMTLKFSKLICYILIFGVLILIKYRGFVTAFGLLGGTKTVSKIYT